MAELPDINIEQAMADAGMAQGGPPGGLPPGGPPGAPPEGMPAEGGMPPGGGMPSEDEINAILSGLEGEAMVPPPEPGPPPGPDFGSIMDKFKGGDDDEKMLLSSRVEELENQLSSVMDRFKQQKVQSETTRVRTAIDRAVKGAMKDVVTGHDKLDKTAADFVEGTLVYRLAQQQQKNPQAPVDTDAITRFATKAAQALSRWAKEHSKKSEVETRKASVGTTTRPKAEDFELKTDADFDKYVAAFIGKGG